MKKLLCLLILALGLAGMRRNAQQLSKEEVDGIVRKLMDTAHVTGLCVGIIRDGKIAYVQAYGYKNKPLGQLNDTATCFYAASFAKAVFAYLVMKLTDEGVIDLDKPLYEYLPKPLPEYDNYKDLAGDDRWKLLTARICLDHTTGFPNFRWANPRGNNKLEFFFTPGTRYGYSGEGMLLLQLAVETVTGRRLDSLAMEKVFIPLGMRRTSYVWEPSFEDDYAVGHLENETAIPKKKRTKAGAAGSMETTIADYTRFLAAVLRGEGLSEKAWKEMTSRQILIHSAHQFPSLDTATTTENDKIALGYGLGWGICQGQKGKMFFKEGHDDGWEHLGVCMPEAHEAVVVMTNSSNGERIFKEIFEKLAGVEIPWEWELYTPY
jgi:CubicO group peptidase (beta-lactamase class C family)